MPGIEPMTTEFQTLAACALPLRCIHIKLAEATFGKIWRKRVKKQLEVENQSDRFQIDWLNQTEVRRHDFFSINFFSKQWLPASELFKTRQFL